MDAAITSLQNPRFKSALALHRSRDRKRQNRILVHGEREIRRMVASDIKLDELFVSDRMADQSRSNDLADSFRNRGGEVVGVADALLGKLSYGDRSDGIVATAHRPQTDLARLPDRHSDLVVVLESIEKPGNVGAVIRTAVAAGCSTLILSDPVTDLFHPNSIRASLGHCFTIAAATASSSETLQWLSEHGFHIFASRVDARQSFFESDFSGRAAVVLGSEADGLSNAWHGEEVIPVRVPMSGAVDSLNISVTAGIILYEAARQRGMPST